MQNRRWHDWWQKRREDVAAFAVMTFFFACFFYNVLFRGRFIIAGDAYYYSYPLRTVAWKMIRSGELPLWTPSVLSGYPLLSMSQVAIGYPLTWIYLFVHGPWAEQLYVLAPFFLTPMFTYAYIRELGRSRLAALFFGLAFAYGGMMCGFISNSGLLTNSLMWTPLVLLFVDRAQRRGFAHCLLWAAVAYALSVLAGHGQSYVYVGTLAVAYGLFLSLAAAGSALTVEHSWRNLRLRHWQPLFVAVGSLVVAAGVAAFQLLETLGAARRSIRSDLSYSTFGEGSFTLREALLSIGAPLYHYVDTSAYIAPIAIASGVVALFGAKLSGVRDARFWFWFGTAIVAFVLMLGTNTPFYHVVFRIPVLNQFRVPSRHTFEWTMAICLLAAYGWDSLRVLLARGRPRRLEFPLAIALFVILFVMSTIWWHVTISPPTTNLTIFTGLPERYYWLWKLLVTPVVFVVAWLCLKHGADRRRTVLLTATVLLSFFVEQSATISCWWGERLSLDAARLQLTSPTTRYLQNFAPEQNRVYSRVELFSEEFNSHPRLEAPNLTAVYGLQDLAGMEPLIFERYSRALGGVGPDSVTPRAGFGSNQDLFDVHSHVLDLLNATHVVSFTNLKPFEDALTLKDGIGVADADLGITLPPGSTAELPAFGCDGDEVVAVASLANSVASPDGAPVARLRLHKTNEGVVDLILRAGSETSEWAHDRPDVMPVIKHQEAPIFDSRPGDPAGTFSSHRYWARFKLGSHQQISRVEITNTDPAATLAVWKITVHDSVMAHSTPLMQNPPRLTLAAARWRNEAEFAGVFVLRNANALPRAWLASRAEFVGEEEALRRIRGQGAGEFDPQRTALLEVRSGSLPALPNGTGTQKPVRITSYSPTRMRMETDSPAPTVLVVSEIYYPGWQATIDGKPAEILLTDYILRGLILPAGKHSVEMHYSAPAARNGGVISALGLCVLGGLSFAAYFKRARKAEPSRPALKDRSEEG